jgi:hypothetical protein
MDEQLSLLGTESVRDHRGIDRCRIIISCQRVETAERDILLTWQMAALAGRAVTDPYASVAIDTAARRADSRLSGALISGMVYGVASGHTKVVVAPV